MTVYNYVNVKVPSIMFHSRQQRTCRGHVLTWGNTGWNWS